MLPARAAKRVDNFQPEMTAAAYAVIGVIVGLLVAIAAVNARVIAVNVILSAAWIWLLAVVSVTDAVRAGRTSGTAQLATWQFTEGGWFRGTLYFPGALLMLGGALLVGVFAALPADKREENRIAIAVSGMVGPLLVAAAYFLSAPKLTVRPEQLSAYLFAPYAVLAGLAGSALVAGFTPLRPKRPRPAPVDVPEPTPTPVDEEPTTPLRPVTSKPATSTPVRSTPVKSTPATSTPVKSKAAKSTPARSTPANSTSDKAEQTVRLDATKPDEPAPTPATGQQPVQAPAPTVTGRATVAQPLWPGRPRPRKRRDTRDTRDT
jgi:hypothetical protein